MGWNSWDAYNFTIDESQFKANATVLAGMQQFGWKYVVIDEGWYMANPTGNNRVERKYQLERLWPADSLHGPVSRRQPTEQA